MLPTVALFDCRRNPAGAKAALATSTFAVETLTCSWAARRVMVGCVSNRLIDRERLSACARSAELF
jgi:hypothetical protein